MSVYCLGCQGGEVEVVELLLDAGAEVNHAAQDKTMAVHLASAAKETKCQPCPPYTPPPCKMKLRVGLFLQKCLDPISICLYSFYNKKAKLKCFFFSHFWIHAAHHVFVKNKSLLQEKNISKYIDMGSN